MGYGRIGRRVGELLLAFGAKVSVYDPYVAPGAIADGLTLVEDFDVALAHADVISLHASGADILLDAEAFEHVQDGVLLLNSARGELVDEAALCKALDSGKIGGAWMDAFVDEPYTGPLCDYDHVLLTPHVGTYTRQCRLDMETAAVKNLLSDLGIA